MFTVVLPSKWLIRLSLGFSDHLDFADFSELGA
jgi:hypothetical protein